MSGASLYLGIDGGGTKCVARLFSENEQELAVGFGGPANAYQSIDLTKKSILDAAYSAIDSANLSRDIISQITVGAGLAGVNVPSVMQTMQSWQHPFKSFFVTTDVHIACVGAHHQNTGAVVIVGTGSCGYARIEKNNSIEEIFIGGHGFPIGDQASGAWMGFEAVKFILLAQDEIIPPTLLTETIFKQWKISKHQLLDKIATAKSVDFARLAICVFDAAEAGDQIANSILNQAAVYINNLINKLNEKNPGRIALIGGLSKKIKPHLALEVQALLSESLSEPEVGAFWCVK